MRWIKSSKGAGTVGFAVIVAMISVVAIVGSGLDKTNFQLGSGFAWLSSTKKGQAVLANGSTGKGSSKLNFPNAAGGKMRFVQRDGHTYVVVDEPGGTRTLYRLDDASLGTGSQRKIDDRDQLVRGGNTAALVNEATGVVQPIDTENLTPKGDRLQFDAPIRAQADDDGRLAVLELAKAKVSLVEHSTASSPIEVGQPGDALDLSLVGGTPVAVDLTNRGVTTLVAGQPSKATLSGSDGELAIASEMEGRRLVLLERRGASGALITLNIDDGSNKRLPLDFDVSHVRPPFATRDAVFVVNPSSGSVTTIDPETGATRTTVDTELGKGDAAFEVFVKDGYLWVNNPDDSKAVVLDRNGKFRTVDKYDESIPVVAPDTPPDDTGEAAQGEQNGPDNTPSAPKVTTPTRTGDTGQPTAPPTTSPDVPPPVASTPSEPPGFVATPGDGEVSLSWQAPSNGGSPIAEYSLNCRPDCGGQPSKTLAGGQQAETVAGLKNGTAYEFSLSARNEIGAGPSSDAGPVTPTGDIPDPPDITSVSANNDGTVKIEWKTAAQGLTLTGFDVVASSSGSGVRPSSVKFSAGASETSFTTKPGDLGFDDDATGDYTFVITALATKDGQAVTSKPSQPSQSVDPYMAPSFKPGDRVTVAVTSGKANLSWPTAAANGRTASYKVCEDPCTSHPELWSGSGTQAPLSGMTDGRSYNLEVVAENIAGPNTRPLIASNVVPHDKPVVTVTGSTNNNRFTQIEVNFTVNWFGMQAGNCTATVSPSGGNINANCSQVTVSGLDTGKTYDVVVCATNSAGEKGCLSPARQQKTRDPISTTVDVGPVINSAAAPPCNGDKSKVALHVNADYSSAYISSPCKGTGTRIELVCEKDGSSMRNDAGQTSSRWFKDRITGGWLARWWVSGTPTDLGLPSC